MAKDVEQLSIRLNLESGDFASQIKSINSALSSLEKQFRQLDKGLEKDSFQHYALQIDKAKKSIELMNKEIEVQQKQQKALAKTLDEQFAKRQKLIDAGEQDSKAYKTNEKNIARNQKVYDNLTNSITNNQAKIKNWANEILDANTAVQKLENNAKTLEQRLSKVSSNESLKASEYARLNAELGETGNFFQRLSNQINKMQSDKAFNTQRIGLYNQEISRLEKDQAKLLRQQQQLRKQISQTESALTNSKAEYGESSQQVSKLEMSLASLKDELRGVDNALDANADSLADYRTQVNNLEAENTNLDRSLSRIRFDEVGNRLKTIGSSLKSVGTTLTHNVTIPMATAGVAVAKMSMDYQKSLNKVGTITKLGGKALQDYGEQAIEISNQTGIAVTDINEAIYQAVSGGVEVGKATKFVSDAMKLSIGGFADSADTIDLLTTLYNVYGDKIGDVTKVSDKLIATQNLGKTTVGELSQQMGEVVSVAGTYGVSMDNVLASYAKLTAGGLNTAKSTRVKWSPK